MAHAGGTDFPPGAQSALASRNARASNGDLLGGLVSSEISEHGALKAEIPVGFQHGLLQQQKSLHRTVELGDMTSIFFISIFIFEGVERDVERGGVETLGESFGGRREPMGSREAGVGVGRALGDDGILGGGDTIAGTGTDVEELVVVGDIGGGGGGGGRRRRGGGGAQQPLPSAQPDDCGRGHHQRDKRLLKRAISNATPRLQVSNFDRNETNPSPKFQKGITE